MADSDVLMTEVERLRVRLSGLTAAMLRISENLEFDTVLQEAADSARTLTGAHYAVVSAFGDAKSSGGGAANRLLAGFSEQEGQTQLGDDASVALFTHLHELQAPLRTPSFSAHAESHGLGESELRIGPLLSSPMKVRERQVGSLSVWKRSGSDDFTHEDEEILAPFACQAALALTNARRHGEERRARADIEALVDASPVGVVVVDVLAENTVLINPEARRLLRLAPDQDSCSVARLEQLRFKRLDGSEIAVDEMPFEPALHDGQTVFGEALAVVHPDGTEVTTLVNATPILSDDGDLVSVIATLQDLTPLEDLERLRADYLAMVSHELRSPLTSIKGAAATMRNAPVPPDAAEAHQFFCIVEEQADVMRDLINDLLEMTRIETGMLSVTPAPLNMASVIEQAKSAFVSSGGRHSVEIELAPNLPLLWGDRQRIAQVLVKLLSNAAASSPQWSTISVTASVDVAHAAISVSDTGAGIAPEHLPLLFTKFARGGPDAAGDGGSDRNAVGRGLGLAICKGIVEAHGGRIWADRAGPDGGARISFSLPALFEPAAAAVRPEAEAAEGRRTGQAPAKVERILVIDDDPEALRFVRAALQRAGYTPIVTADPSEAEHLFEAERPHLVLLDVVLRGTDGFELVKRFPRMLEVPVIFMSGRGDDRFVAQAFDLGATDYIVKPFSPTELLARSSAALRRHSQSQHAERYRAADLTVDFLMRTVTVAGRPVNLTPTEYQLLAVLCTNAPRTLSYDQLLEHLWGGSGDDVQRVRGLVRDLRAKLGDDARNPTYILTVPRVGYSAAAA